MHIDLLELPYFEGISLDDLVSLVDKMRPVQFAKGEIIVRERREVPPLYIATAGRVLISKKNAAGTPRALAELDAPTLFGEIELFCQLPAVCTAEALSRVSAFTLDRPTYEALFASRHPGLVHLTFNVARVACHRLAIADEMFTHALADEDLCKLRRTVWAQMLSQDDAAITTTGAFKRPF